MIKSAKLDNSFENIPSAVDRASPRLLFVCSSSRYSLSLCLLFSMFFSSSVLSRRRQAASSTRDPTTDEKITAGKMQHIAGIEGRLSNDSRGLIAPRRRLDQRGFAEEEERLKEKKGDRKEIKFKERGRRSETRRMEENQDPRGRGLFGPGTRKAPS